LLAPAERRTEGERRLSNIADTVVFGAGPAGLAAAIASIHEGRRVLLLELGKGVTERGRYDPLDLVAGVGGAGLYSDGKFSFYPSASHLWRLHDRKSLEAAYSWLANLLQDSTEAPSFPDLDRGLPPVRYSELQKKTYESKYIGFEARIKLIERLSQAVGEALVTGATVTQLDYLDDGICVEYEHSGQLHSTRAQTAVLACGRFGGLKLRDLAPWLPTVFRRYEIGVRVEYESTDFFLRDHPSLDPKYIIADPEGIEWRTFCVCRNGEIVKTNFFGLTTFSGRTDDAATERSNMGFNVRITDEPESGMQLQKELEYLLAGHIDPFRLELERFMVNEVSAYGPHLDDLLRKGFSMLDPNALRRATITGPCIEGIGYYPSVDGHLRVGDLPVWVAGDETGVFRGLVAALISGHYAASQVQRYLADS
jgi:uncharacterized protein